MYDLKILLLELNDWLKAQNIEIEIIVIGAYALHLHNISSRMTMDIDTVKAVTEPEVLKKITEIGMNHGTPEWLNDQADSVVMPDGYERRLLTNTSYCNIHLKYVSRIDLIKLKVAAYFYRHEYEAKDYEDLLLLKPTAVEITDAISFLKEKHLPDVLSFQKKFLKEVTEIEDLIRKIGNG